MPMVSTMPAMPGSVSVAWNKVRMAVSSTMLTPSASAGESAEQSVADADEDGDGEQTEDRGVLAGLHRIRAQLRPDGALFDDAKRGGKRARVQQHGELARRLHREIALDIALPAQDRAPDDGRRDHLVVEHDGKAASDIGSWSRRQTDVRRGNRI